MTAKDAAKIIGCSTAQVRNLIRGKQIKAEVYSMPGGFYYDLLAKDVRRYANTPQTIGFPRGQKRKEK